MDGLDRITEEIKKQAAAEAEEILAQAKEKAEAALARAKNEAAAKRAEAEAAADKQVAALNAARESAQALRRQQIMLETKQDVLGQTLDEARAAVLALPKDQYFGLCVNVAVSYANAGEGEILFNEKDKARLPEDFAERLEKALPSGKKARVSERTAPIDGGFLLKYGDMEENCSIFAIFRDRRDEFVDVIRGILF